MSEEKYSYEDYKKLKDENTELKFFITQMKELSYYSETDLEGIITDISDSFCNAIGYTKEEMLGKNHSILRHPLEKKSKYTNMWKTIKQGKVWIGELRCLTKKGKDIWYNISICPKIDFFGNMIGYSSRRQDITDKKRLEDLSITDELTALYNKRFFQSTLKKLREKAKKINRKVTLIMIDVDDFKRINDEFGHLKGDDVLIKVAAVLKKFTKRQNDFAFRLGGDEFSILTLALSKEDVLSYANAIKDEISKLDFGKYKINISISIGVYLLNPKEKINLRDIYHYSDEALYEAKKLGKNRVVIYKYSYSS